MSTVGISIIVALFLTSHVAFSTSSQREYDLLVYKKGNNTLVEDSNKDVIIQERDSTVAIQRGIYSLPNNGIMLISGGKYNMTGSVNLIPTISVKGNGHGTDSSAAVLDYSTIRNDTATIVMAKESTLSDITISGSASHKLLPEAFTHKLQAADEVVIERIHLQNLPYGIETANTKNVKLIGISCKNIYSKEDWGACIHAGGKRTSNLSVENFTAIDSNRGIEIDASASNITVENGYLENIKNFAGTGNATFSIDVHNHDKWQGETRDITYRNIYLKNTDAPSVYVASTDHMYRSSDQPRNILFENITVENPNSPW